MGKVVVHACVYDDMDRVYKLYPKELIDKQLCKDKPDNCRDCLLFPFLLDYFGVDDFEVADFVDNTCDVRLGVGGTDKAVFVWYNNRWNLKYIGKLYPYYYTE